MNLGFTVVLAFGQTASEITKISAVDSRGLAVELTLLVLLSAKVASNEILAEE